MSIMHWTPPTSMDNPSVSSLWFIMLLSVVLSYKEFLAFSHINSVNKDLSPKHKEQPLSM